MKKILLASTILAGTAGFAAADNANFTFSGEAYTGIAYTTGDETVSGIDWNQDGDTLDTSSSFFAFEVTAAFTAGMMTTTDGGLEAGADVTVNAAGMSTQDDHTLATFGTSTAGAGGSIDDASVWLSGEWGKVEVAYDNNGTADVLGFTEPDVTFTYSNSFGDFDVEAYYTWSYDSNGAGGVFNGATGLSDGDLGLQGTYNFADYSIYAGFNWDASDALGTGDWNIDLGASASMNGFSASVEANYNNFAADWDLSAEASYTMDAYTIGAFAEDDNGVDTSLDFGVNGSYDLGGGVSVDAAYIYDNDGNTSLAKVGVSMAF